MARDFNGTTGYLSCGSMTHLNNAFRPMTIVARVNIDTLSDYGVIFQRGRFEGGGGWTLRLGPSGGGQLDYTFNDVAANTSSGLSLATGTQYLVGAALSTTNIRLFHCTEGGTFTGANVSSSSTGNTPSQDLTKIGAGGLASGTGYFFDGRISEVAIWSAELSDVELTAMGKGFSPNLIRPASRLAYWPIIGKSDPEPELIRGFGGTLSGTANAASHPRVINPRRRQAFSVAAAAGGGPGRILKGGLIRGGLLRGGRLVG